MASSKILPKMKVKQKLSTAKNALRAVKDGAISASELAKLEKELKGLVANADGPTKTQLERVAKQLGEARASTKPRVTMKPSTQAKDAPKPRVKMKPKTEPKANTRGVQKPAGKGTLKNITEATARTGSRIGKLAKAGTGIGALLAADEVGRGSDVVPAGRRDEFVKRMDKERKEKDVKRVKAATEANSKLNQKAKEDDVKRVKAATETHRKLKESEKPETYKIKKGDTLSQIAKDKGVRVSELMKKNPQITDKNKIYAGRSLKLNKGGYANCGASMKPNGKSRT